MYTNIKSCVQYNNTKSDFFPCMIGVRQGENLSPFLFSIFLNDLEDYFRELHVLPLELIKEKCYNELHVFLEIFVLLYADDTVIFADNYDEMQNALKVFENYCKMWKLSVNIGKTKVMVFSKRKSKMDFDFKLDGTSLEIVDSYTYLGLLLNYNGSFVCAKKKLVEQSQKALFAVYTKIRNLHLPIDLQLKLFDYLVEPILLYGSEIWGFENIDIIEKVHLQFCKRILNVRSSTPNVMVYGELGRFPLEIKVKLRMLSFWSRMAKNENKLSSSMYKLIFKLHADGICEFKWVSFVKSIFDNSGLGYMFFNQYIDYSTFKPVIKQILQDQFLQKWSSNIDNSSRGEYYKLFKSQFGLENYLLRLPEDKRIWISKLRTCNLKIPMETGRWYNIARTDRICTLCNESCIGDEYHYLYVCNNSSITELRKKYIPKYYTTYPSVLKMQNMLSLCHCQLLYNLAIFIKKLSTFI